MRYLETLPKALAIAPIVFLAIACASTGTTGNVRSVSRDDATSSDSADPPNSVKDDNEEKIRDQRTHDSFTPDFAIGPGDVLDVSVPDVPEINSRVERVSAQGTIDLPVAGEITIGGLTEDQARDAIRQSLSKLVKDPDVNLFVKEYKSRQVAVVGMVNRPGLYSLNSRSDTVLDLIGRAGGMTERASNEVMLIPAPPSSGGRIPSGIIADLHDSERRNSLDIVAAADQLRVQTATNAQGPVTATTPDQQGTTKAPYFAVPKGADSVSIDLTKLTRGSPDDIPVRPGDVIIVPASGSVLVQGWVRTPGAYPITPGLTEYGAISAAGGAMFSSTARLLRMEHSGARTEYEFDIAKIENGEQQDIPVQSGDVVVVNKSATGALPYGVYFLAEHFGTGISMGTTAF
jgi:protein involved in polysaccharide export with SLBB domain